MKNRRLQRHTCQLVHSCWRVDKDTKFGTMPYQIHLIIYGHPTALARVQSVEYRLPGYPNGHDQQSGGPPKGLFELKELANGFSIAQAIVNLRSQPPGQSRILRLSRLINMSESGLGYLTILSAGFPRKCNAVTNVGVAKLWHTGATRSRSLCFLGGSRVFLR